MHQLPCSGLALLLMHSFLRRLCRACLRPGMHQHCSDRKCYFLLG